MYSTKRGYPVTFNVRGILSIERAVTSGRAALQLMDEPKALDGIDDELYYYVGEAHIPLNQEGVS